ncbi:natural product biosynthesis luciferase-like monooxygenase protein [Advenella incenata]|uniref:Natural product biosynthesis luciferase-like monooxygenase protein n=1 Tax=Advenella incenata TaxID=267800 RepID=A0A4Q7VRA7_9BURK|nr:MupA/Atu3671 family FMN-dependent luciferase-like monooxygenase [Advenella incenata]RZT99033.1 natural product biosynthesis luciferase-like monooxygenase protein [Advenella incenata]
MLKTNNETSISQAISDNSANHRIPKFSVFFFSGEAPTVSTSGIYDLVMNAAKLAEEAEFEAIWLPERHFHAFGGLFPSPAIVASAIAATTKRLGIRAGSVVLPLHNPINVAEEWSVIDNISSGRVGMSVAPGFHPSDFVLKPENYSDRREIFRNNVTDLLKLWRGESFTGKDGLQRETSVVTLPRPYQKSLPLWITASESEDSFKYAGGQGANILTSLLALDRKTLASRIQSYRECLQPNCTDQEGGTVTLMLHTYVSSDEKDVEQHGVQPLKNYLKEHLNFAAPRADYSKINKLSDSDKDALVEHAARRYTRDASLIGTPEHCRKVIDDLMKIGVDEIACLIDFGVPTEQALQSLKEVAAIKAEIESEHKLHIGV